MRPLKLGTVSFIFVFPGSSTGPAMECVSTSLSNGDLKYGEEVWFDPQCCHGWYVWGEEIEFF